MANSLYSSRAIPVDPRTFLKITFWNPDAGTSGIVHTKYTIALPDGKLVDGIESTTVPASATEYATYIPMTTGQLLNVSVYVTSSVLQSGDLFCSIGLQRGSAAIPSAQLPLTSGYIVANSVLNYPDSEPKGAIDTQGHTLGIAPSTPAAGDGITIEFDPLYEIFIESFTYRLNADATVATRSPIVTISSTWGMHWSCTSNTNVTASQAITYYACQTPIPATNPANVGYIGMPPMYWMLTCIVDMTFVNIQPADQINAACVMYRRRLGL